MNSTPRPSCRNWRNTCMSSSISCGARTLVGSSKIKNLALAMSSFTISTFWRSPCDSARTVARGSIPNR